MEDERNMKRDSFYSIQLAFLKNEVYCDFVLSKCITKRENIKWKREREKQKS